MPVDKRLELPRPLLDTIERVMLPIICPPVIGISAAYGSGRSIDVYVFAAGALPEPERQACSEAAQEILEGVRGISAVRVLVFDYSVEPLHGIGTWIFVRKGVRIHR
jgi:hypothetical protein